MMHPRFLRILLSILVLTPGAIHARADVSEAARAFDEGNRRYESGNYDEAVDAYRRALDEGFASDALYYNMGNAFYRMDQIGEAVRAYERARLLVPDDARILHNLAIARERTVDRFSRVPDPFWRGWWDALVRALGAWGLFLIGAVFWTSVCAIVIHRTLTGQARPWLRRILSSAVIAGFLFLSLAFGASLENAMRQRAVVTAEEVPLYAMPSSTSAAELTVHEGLIVDVLGQRDQWIQLRLPNGVTGWADRRTISEI